MLAAACLTLVTATLARAQTTVGTPDVSGDQLIFFYDARAGRVPFLSVSNSSDSPIDVEVAYYDTSLSARLGAEVVPVAGGGNLVIDPTSTSSGAAGGVANGKAGLAIVTPVAGPASSQPIVPPSPLTGNFTLANTTLGSAFGENALARLAVDGSGQHAAAGQNVDGNAVKYQRFAPNALVVPVFFNPNTLDPADQDGNRVILAAFTDHYGAQFDVAAVSQTAQASFLAKDGVRAAAGSVSIQGVLLSNLQEIAGSSAVFTSSGKLFLQLGGVSGNVFGIFSQSVAPFASGQRLPAVNSVPSGTTPTPGGTPTPRSTSTGSTVTPTPNPGSTPTPKPTTGGATPTPKPTGGNTPTPNPTGGGSCTTVSVTVTVNYNQTDFPDVSGVQVGIGYPGATLEIPGTGNDPQVLASIDNLTSVTNGVFSAGDSDGDPNNSILNIGLLSLSTPIPPGNFARAHFSCKGGSVPAASAFSCTPSASGFTGNTVTGISCSLSVTTP
jgi:hypothetical protein